MYVRQMLSDAYTEVFGAAVEEYNAKQKRVDRKIANYYEHLFGTQSQKHTAIADSKERSFDELLVQVGDMYDSSVGSADGELAARCLDEYMRGFQERNPQFLLYALQGAFGDASVAVGVSGKLIEVVADVAQLGRYRGGYVVADDWRLARGHFDARCNLPDNLGRP